MHSEDEYIRVQEEIANALFKCGFSGFVGSIISEDNSGIVVGICQHGSPLTRSIIDRLKPEIEGICKGNGDFVTSFPGKIFKAKQ